MFDRRYEANLMTCLLYDPYLKVFINVGFIHSCVFFYLSRDAFNMYGFQARIASASTLATMLEGPASVFLQVAEYKESTKLGSFTALSSSLGQILMQLHTGIYLISFFLSFNMNLTPINFPLIHSSHLLYAFTVL